jgi:hypothetical protein
MLTNIAFPFGGFPASFIRTGTLKLLNVFSEMHSVVTSKSTHLQANFAGPRHAKLATTTRPDAMGRLEGNARYAGDEGLTVYISAINPV